MLGMIVLVIVGVGLIAAILVQSSNQPVYPTVHPNDSEERKMVTTANSLHGYEIEASLGVVRGITVRSRSIAGTWFGGMQSIIGGQLTVFSQLCEDSRAEAFALMMVHAKEIGANAIIAHRMDSNELGAGITEVLAYGTAVKVRPSLPTDHQGKP